MAGLSSFLPTPARDLIFLPIEINKTMKQFLCAPSSLKSKVLNEGKPTLVAAYWIRTLERTLLAAGTVFALIATQAQSLLLPWHWELYPFFPFPPELLQLDLMPLIWE